MPKKILVVTSYDSTFVQTDIEILKKYFSTGRMEGQIRVLDFTGIQKNVKDIFKTIVKLLLGVLWADLTYIWFADFRAFIVVVFSKIFKKKTCVMIGGYEVAKVPQYNYGGLLASSIFLRFTLKNCNKILCPSDFTNNEVSEFYPNSKTKTVPLGVKITDFDNDQTEFHKENLIVTVANALSNPSQIYKLKGLVAFAKAAKICSDFHFVVIGKYERDVKTHLKEISSSLQFTGYIPAEEVKNYLERAKVYCQLSLRESFGLSIAEAMNCQATPVVTKLGAIPEIVANAGYYVPFNDAEETAIAIKKAIEHPKGKSAQERIIKYFSVSKREKTLIKELELL